MHVIVLFHSNEIKKLNKKPHKCLSRPWPILERVRPWFRSSASWNEAREFWDRDGKNFATEIMSFLTAKMNLRGSFDGSVLLRDSNWGNSISIVNTLDRESSNTETPHSVLHAFQDQSVESINLSSTVVLFGGNHKELMACERRSYQAGAKLCAWIKKSWQGIYLSPPAEKPEWYILCRSWDSLIVIYDAVSNPLQQSWMTWW